MVIHDCTWMPRDLRCISFFMSLTLPDAASRAFDGTHPLLTQVPPISWPSIIAVFIPCMSRPCLTFNAIGWRFLLRHSALLRWCILHPTLHLQEQGNRCYVRLLKMIRGLELNATMLITSPKKENPKPQTDINLVQSSLTKTDQTCCPNQEF